MDTAIPDGISLRPIEPGDADGLRRLFFRLSPQTVYLRFFSPVRDPSESALHRLAEVDHVDREALVAEADGEIIGVARYDRDPDDPSRAEAAILVEDAWQGHGLASSLLTRLGQAALGHGIKTLTANILGENQRAMTLARHLVAETSVSLDHGEWQVEVPLPRAGRRVYEAGA